MARYRKLTEMPQTPMEITLKFTEDELYSIQEALEQLIDDGHMESDDDPAVRAFMKVEGQLLVMEASQESEF